MGGPEPTHLSFSYTKHQLAGGGGGYRGVGVQRPQSTVAEESLLTQMPPSRTDVALCAQQGGERYGVHSTSWPAQHARASLSSMHGLLAEDNTPYAGLNAWHQLQFQTASLCTETTGTHHGFSLSGEQREKWKHTTNYWLPFLSNLSLRVLFT